MGWLKSIGYWLVQFWGHWYGKCVSFIVPLGSLIIWFLKSRKTYYEGITAKVEAGKALEEKEISKYFDQIVELDVKTPGGLRSQPMADEGENQKLVNKAWERFVANKTRNSKGRFNG